ncbi:MAG: DUF2085 domain-containing protein [Actinomycetes bacterium]|jgi:uncharacterized membrane protein|nr:DUF2085 domain-containing protein [Actinomycetes bacterium]
MENILHILGFGLCHQIHERSFDFFGLQWPVCARCSGIYLGLVAGFAALLLAYRGRQRDGAPTVGFWIFAALSLLAMAADGFSSYLGWRATDNLLRLLTGTAVGGTLAGLLYTMLVGNLARRCDPARPFAADRGLAWFVGAMLLVPVLADAAGPVIGYVMAVVTGLCIIVTFTLLVLVIVSLFRRVTGSVSRARDLLVPVLVSLPIGLLLIGGCYLLKAWAIGYVPI